MLDLEVRSKSGIESLELETKKGGGGGKGKTENLELEKGGGVGGKEKLRKGGKEE